MKIVIPFGNTGYCIRDLQEQIDALRAQGYDDYETVYAKSFLHIYPAHKWHKTFAMKVPEVKAKMPSPAINCKLMPIEEGFDQ